MERFRYDHGLVGVEKSSSEERRSRKQKVTILEDYVNSGIMEDHGRQCTMESDCNSKAEIFKKWIKHPESWQFTLTT